MVRLIFVSVVACISTASSAVVNLSSGLVGKYEFSGNADDSSGNSFNGTVFSASLAPDRFGNANSAYIFNGSSSYISLGNQTAFNFGTGNFSISAWIKMNGAQSDNYFFSKYGGAGAGYGVGTGWGSSLYGFVGTNSGGANQAELRTSVDLNDNAWHHVVFTYNYGAAAKLYLDNSEIHSFDISYLSGSLDSAAPVLFGKYDGAVPANHFNGSMDEVAIYNRVLSPSEVTALFLVPEPSSLSLLLAGGTLLFGLRNRLKSTV